MGTEKQAQLNQVPSRMAGFGITTPSCLGVTANSSAFDSTKSVRRLYQYSIGDYSHRWCCGARYCSCTFAGTAIAATVVAALYVACRRWNFWHEAYIPKFWQPFRGDWAWAGPDTTAVAKASRWSCRTSSTQRVHPGFDHGYHDASGGYTCGSHHGAAGGDHDGSSGYGIYCLSRRSCFYS